jgi:hypothetical protein
MSNILDISDHIARRLMASDGAAARQRVASIERAARADGNMARARLAADVARPEGRPVGLTLAYGHHDQKSCCAALGRH